MKNIFCHLHNEWWTRVFWVENSTAICSSAGNDQYDNGIDMLTRKLFISHISFFPPLRVQTRRCRGIDCFLRPTAPDRCMRQEGICFSQRLSIFICISAQLNCYSTLHLTSHSSVIFFFLTFFYCDFISVYGFYFIFCMSLFYQLAFTTQLSSYCTFHTNLLRQIA